MEVAKVDVGVKVTRARAAALSIAADVSRTAKRRKICGGGGDGEGGMKLPSSLVGQAIITPDSSTSPSASGESTSCSADHEPASCCSSNGPSEEQMKHISKFVDLEVESIEVDTWTYKLHRKERREMSPSSELQAESGELESTQKPSQPNSRCHRRPTVVKMPSDAELKDFFAAADKDLQKQFTQKYNYDIVKDAPLEGRYEWVRLKP